MAMRVETNPWEAAYATLLENGLDGADEALRILVNYRSIKLTLTRKLRSGLELSWPDTRNGHATKEESERKPKQIDALEKMDCPLAAKTPKGIDGKSDRRKQNKVECFAKFGAQRAHHTNQNSADAKDENECAMQRNGNTVCKRLSSW